MPQIDHFVYDGDHARRCSRRHHDKSPPHNHPPALLTSQITVHAQGKRVRFSTPSRAGSGEVYMGTCRYFMWTTCDMHMQWHPSMADHRLVGGASVGPHPSWGSRLSRQRGECS